MDVIPNTDAEEQEPDYTNFEMEDIVNKLQNLKDNYRIVLSLNLIEGYDYEEIAEILNYTNENVRTTISRAKKKLKQVLLQTNNQKKLYGR